MLPYQTDFQFFEFIAKEYINFLSITMYLYFGSYFGDALHAFM